MIPLEITKLSRDNKDKYDKLMAFIQKWWSLLTLEELIVEIKRVFILQVTKENLETFRLSLGLNPKGLVEASKRKFAVVQFPEKLARAVFLEFYDMDSFLTVEEQKRLDESYIAEKTQERHTREMEKYGRTWE